jgi:hypothetical protein
MIDRSVWNWQLGVCLVTILAACSNTPSGTSSSSSTTTGASTSTTGTGTTGSSSSTTSSTSSSTTTTSSSSGGSTTAATTSAGSTTSAVTTTSSTTSAGSTSAGSTTAGNGTTTGTGTTGTSTSGTTSSGSTTGTFSPPFPDSGFVPYDAGPRNETPIAYDAGCSPLFPVQSGNQCVQCTKNTQCNPMFPGQDAGVCETNSQAYSFYHRCVECSKSSDCPTGYVCNQGVYNQALEKYGDDTCVPDCSSNPQICVPGACEGDSGVCLSNINFTIYDYGNMYCYMNYLTGLCQTGADCSVDGGGACNSPQYNYPEYYYPYSNGWGFCVPCTVDGGGCPSPDEFCQQWDNTCSYNEQGQYVCHCSNGPAGSCQFNCFLDAGACGNGTYCTDAGPVGIDGGIMGGCAPGCQNVSNCGGSTPVCNSDAGYCVQCNTGIDCPDWTPGCQYNSCGHCGSNSDCPGSEQCNNGYCGCSSDNDCPLDVPTCVGASGGYTGACACSDTSQCLGGYICETRSPYTVVNYNTYQQAGGACVAPCTSNSDCALTFPGTNNLVCDTTTGYCVPCVQDSDCTSIEDPNKPWVTPSCVQFVDGGNPNTYPTLYTGGGQCGCTDSSQCNGLYLCQNPGLYGTCTPSCSVQNGVDSCTPQYASPYNCPNNYYPGPYCNTYTGMCQQCLDDYDCSARGYQGNTCNTPFCSDAGMCVGCFTGDDCTTFPNNSCYYGSCSNYCNDSSQCPSDGGYVCESSPYYGEQTCVIPCVIGDDAGMGTVSDAGNPCPADSPFCVTNPYGSDATMGVCGSCLSYGDYTNCNESLCSCGSGYAYCEGYWCYLYCYCG